MRYELIYLDPPWCYNDKCLAGKRGAALKHGEMDLYDLASIDVPGIAAENCLMALWWVAPMPEEALFLVHSWGFKIKTMNGMVWVKTTKHGKTHWGMGNWTRANAESCLFAVRGKPKRIDRGVHQLITHQTLKNSAKPDEARLRLERLMGDIPRIELFARVTAPGWHALGNEIDGKDIRDAVREVAAL